jgi:phosphomannomutase
MLAALARRAGVRCAVTLTSFKHLVRADPELAFAYEEALGYAVTPQLVRDKDGIGAAVLLADLADELAREGRTLLDRLDELAAVGLYLTAPVTLRLPVEEIAERLRGLAEHPPHRLGAFDVRSAGPIRADEAELPSGAGLVLRLDGGRVVVRASGTEPKIKAYLEVVDVPPGNEEADVARAREAARDRLDGLRRAVEDWLGAQASN